MTLDHPGVALVKAQGKYNVAGAVKVLSDGGFPKQYGDLYMTPSETRSYFEEKRMVNYCCISNSKPYASLS